MKQSEIQIWSLYYKQTMKNILGFLFITALLLTNCKNKMTSENKLIPDPKTEIGKVNDFMKQYEEPSQVFKVLANTKTQVIGKQGTIISVNPTSLVYENGQPLKGNVEMEVELKELKNQQQLLKTNAQTTSSGKLLVSGGAYFINMTSEGQQLKLKDGESLSVEFPKNTSAEMYLFYGQRDTLGQLNWVEAKQKFERKPKQKIKAVVKSDSTSSGIESILGYIEDGRRPLTTKEKKLIEDEKRNAALADKVYKMVELKQFGWINCDRFYDVPNKTNLQYSFNEKDNIVSANVYLVFKDINSVVQSQYFSFEGKEHNPGFQNIPLGAKTQLIAFSIKNGKTYTYKSSLTIKSNETVQLMLKETSQDQMVELFQ